MYDQLCAFCLLIFQHPFKFAVSMLSLSRLLRIIPFPFSSTFPFFLGFERNLSLDFFLFCVSLIHVYLEIGLGT
jgi:hypothetical protein